MFWFENNNICFLDGAESPANAWLCGLARCSGTVFELLSEEISSDSVSPLNCSVENGKICYHTENEMEIARICLSYIRNLQIPIQKCSICGSFFAPVKRNDEKYCLNCRKTGASKTFREKNAADENYTLFMQHTKHLRYLKNKGALTDAAFKRSYEAAKQGLEQVRSGKISLSAYRALLNPAPENVPLRPMESYLL